MEILFGSMEQLTLWGYLFRSLLTGGIVFLVSKVLPRRSGGQYSAYDFTFFWLVGGMLAAPLIHPKIPVHQMLINIGTVFVWHIIHSYGVVKNRWIARLLVGRPVILIENGRILRSVMRKNLISIEMLLAKLRFQEAEDLNQVAFAVLETNGQISVLLKAEAQQVTPNELGIMVPEFRMPIVFINDGVIKDEHLQQYHWDRQKLQAELRKQGVADLEKVYFAACDRMGNLYYSMKG